MMTRLEHYRRIGGSTYETLGEQLGVTRQTAQRYCQPKGHPDHRRPGAAPSDALSDRTHGLIHAGNYADVITETEAAAMMAEIAQREAAGAGA